ncbi:hypothetical protein OAE37_03580 [Pirellulaceae bacterium]|nr:hypothetical protein [Pirellulaceae bacterium]
MIFGSHSIDISRLWIAALLSAILIPIVAGLIHANKIRVSNIAIFMLGVFTGISVVLFLQNDFQRVWNYMKVRQGSLSHNSWDIPILLGVCSGLVTWAMVRKGSKGFDEIKQPIDLKKDDDLNRPKNTNFS